MIYMSINSAEKILNFQSSFLAWYGTKEEKYWENSSEIEQKIS